MRKVLTLVITLVSMFALVVAPVAAIKGDYTPDFDHPFVAMVVFYNADGNFIWRCSGSLISPTVVLTAGHCTDPTDNGDPTAGARSARVWFQQDAGANYDPVTQEDPVTGYPDSCAAGTLGTLCATSSELHNYGTPFAGFPETEDAGLIILDQAISMSEYGQLPAAGILDSLATKRGQNGTVFTVSGYGLSYSSNPKSVVPSLSYRVRLEAQSTLVDLTSALTDGYNLETQGNGNNRGGTCSGDSGGPVFLGGPDSDTIVAVTSFGLNSLCRGTDFSYRIDQAAVLDWINAYLAP